MIRGLFLLMIIIKPAFAENPVGFLWYNLPKIEKKQPQTGVPFNNLSYTDKDAVLKYYTIEALHKVRFTHSIEDERVFLALQDFWLKEASIHGKVNQKALLKYPEYDFSVNHPTSNLGTKLHDSIDKITKRKVIKELAKNTGLLFFYRANNLIDQKQIPILKDFCKSYNFSLIPVSVDGAKSPQLPDTRIDKGQAASLGVRYFPAILLVNPNNNKTIPVAFGLTTQDVLVDHLNQAAQDFGIKISESITDDAFFKEHEFVFFFSSNCPHCKTAAPILKNFAVSHGINVNAYTIDNKTLPDFIDANPPTTELINEAFKDNNIQYPALFIINKSTSALYPVAIGALSSNELNTRMQSIVSKIKDYEQGESP
ncbi:MAG: type-F conjugative transfer system pilin assembly protein TraF [Legionellaceae bacterium]|nr:type-F conjugative transfer system pilin assembly protein TraF [Legionellaceae bacterium]